MSGYNLDTRTHAFNEPCSFARLDDIALLTATQPHRVTKQLCVGWGVAWLFRYFKVQVWRGANLDPALVNVTKLLHHR